MSLNVFGKFVKKAIQTERPSISLEAIEKCLKKRYMSHTHIHTHTHTHTHIHTHTHTHTLTLTHSIEYIFGKTYNEELAECYCTVSQAHKHKHTIVTYEYHF